MGKEYEIDWDWIKKELQNEDLAAFDVKEGQDKESGEPYYKTYLSETKGLCGQRVWGDLSPWEKLCCYKISGSKGVDCDAALRSTAIYQMAFEYGGSHEITLYKNKGEYLLKAKDECTVPTLRGDTMNSYATTVHEFIRLFEHEEETVKKFLQKAKKGRNKGKWETVERVSWERCILENYDYFKKILPEKAEKFFELYHTVGNFIAWPADCNVPRGRGPVKDYWDLTLNCIYQWYQDNETFVPSQNKAILDLFGSEMAVFANWLGSFGQGMDGWHSFVERNFLQVFLDDDGRPKELWKGHFTNGAMPRKEADFDQFFTNASKWIEERGKDIAKAANAVLA